MTLQHWLDLCASDPAAAMRDAEKGLGAKAPAPRDV